MTMPGSTKGGGQCMGTPDTCITPAAPSPVPMVYPNISMPAQATKTATKVKFMNKEVLTEKSEIPKSSGDEAGTNGGVMSGVNMNKTTIKKVSGNVKAQGAGVAHQTSVTGHNGMSANMPAGQQLAPSQTKVLVSP